MPTPFVVFSPYYHIVFGSFVILLNLLIFSWAKIVFCFLHELFLFSLLDVCAFEEMHLQQTSIMHSCKNKGNPSSVS